MTFRILTVALAASLVLTGAVAGERKRAPKPAPTPTYAEPYEARAPLPAPHPVWSPEPRDSANGS